MPNNSFDRQIDPTIHPVRCKQMVARAHIKAALADLMANANINDDEFKIMDDPVAKSHRVCFSDASGYAARKVGQYLSAMRLPGDPGWKRITCQTPERMPSCTSARTTTRSISPPSWVSRRSEKPSGRRSWAGSSSSAATEASCPTTGRRFSSSPRTRAGSPSQSATTHGGAL
ncbi:unnamed protein product [Prorocentrum cordatum]|uniref:RNA-directed RNA polymerase n=1 Tax=Prorocentrum cordatum TaxID=2364126 RepID=A0ABN9XD78_9DINO|nr:unnamed protein product [Polarella glacialis]